MSSISVSSSLKDKKLSDMELETLTQVGKNVRFIRRDLLHMKLHEMSESTGVSRDVLCRLEVLAKGEGEMGKSRTYPSILTLIKFCEGMGITLSELLDIDIPVNAEVQKKIVAKIGIENISNLREI